MEKEKLLQLVQVFFVFFYGSPKSAKAVEKVRKSAVPKKARLKTEWAQKTWHDWTSYRLENLSQDEMYSEYELLSEFTAMSGPRRQL